MADLPPAVVGRAHTESVAWDVLEQLVDVGSRMAGHEGETEARAIVRDELDAIGVRDLEESTFEIPGWYRDTTELHVETTSSTGARASRSHVYDQSHQLFSLPNSPPGEAHGPLVDVGDGRPQDFDAADLDGALVLASSKTPEDFHRYLHRREKYNRAIDAGAAGFLFYNYVDGCLPSTGTVGHQHEYGDIPAAGISKELGARLVRHCDRYDDVTATLTADLDTRPTTSGNVEGVLGPDTDEEVVVTAHVDAHDVAEGARDNGTGTALLVEIARLLSHCESHLDTRVRFVACGSEEIGLLGSDHWAATHDHDAVKAVVNVEAGKSRNLKLWTFQFDALREAFEEVSEELAVPVRFNETVWGHSDAWSFAKRGIPAVSAHSHKSGPGRGFGHTHADTLDKLDRRDLRELAVLLAAGVVKIAEADRPSPHKTVEELRGSIDPGNEEEMKLLGRYP